MIRQLFERLRQPSPTETRTQSRLPRAAEPQPSPPRRPQAGGEVRAQLCEPEPLRVDERRVFARVEEPPLYASGLWATVHDVSVGGICLSLDTPVVPGAQYDLILTDGAAPYTAEIRAEVVWYRKDRAGLRWVDPSPEQQQWLVERFVEWEALEPGITIEPI